MADLLLFRMASLNTANKNGASTSWCWDCPPMEAEMCQKSAERKSCACVRFVVSACGVITSPWQPACCWSTIKDQHPPPPSVVITASVSHYYLFSERWWSEWINLLMWTTDHRHQLRPPSSPLTLPKPPSFSVLAPTFPSFISRPLSLLHGKRKMQEEVEEEDRRWWWWG